MFVFESAFVLCMQASIRHPIFIELRMRLSVLVNMSALIQSEKLLEYFIFRTRINHWRDILDFSCTRFNE